MGGISFCLRIVGTQLIFSGGQSSTLYISSPASVARGWALDTIPNMPIATSSETTGSGGGVTVDGGEHAASGSKLAKTRIILAQGDNEAIGFPNLSS